MRLDELTGERTDAGAVEVTSLAYDSRTVVPGALFLCVSGLARDGHDFAAAAVAAGAVALVVERPLGLGVPELVVPDVRAAAAPLAARFHRDPSRRLRVVGVTGTNGKTTTTFLVRALLEAAGEPCALLGTVKSVIGGRERPLARTTPDAVDLQAALAAMVAAGDRACAMEVSSHALELHRVDAVHFAAAIFTNLTQDHLDFHSSMDGYFAAKRRLFELGPGVAVLNLDDPYGRRLAAEIPDAVTFALHREADYTAGAATFTLTGARFVLRSPEGEVELRSPLPGSFNVSNVLGAVAAVHRMGVRLETIAAALPGIEPVPGRFQPVDEGQGFAVLVDYAHTPDSLENVLRAARGLTGGRLICVFGCGGDRDRGKRPQMGQIAAESADVAIVTSDNPRSEDPPSIVEEVLAGARGPAAVEAVVDRRAAIVRGIGLAGPGDVVVIAGKGHEQGQEFAAGRKLPFDDVEVAREVLRERRAVAPLPR
ncbi:MAG: UDP-N-acetylmuramoyl-L-alanyl-D-glutamate--2,6-diaminopimelate ligase [Solirubrobacteraceae bacterium]|jgi:UDP-N-acetylmuramoyl-L-alanyl-D-glutamate--2,6-diaminopimelate ligase|nr:UDP-N-acetylmuramoyl-L-alanyl-D-glutamate--2,6-diaminopimelate ligase [Solirubrobacteraceae bacterium]